MENKWNRFICIIFLAAVVAALGGCRASNGKSASPSSSAQSVSAAASTPSSANSGPSKGVAAPEITVTDERGKSVSLSSLRGKPVVIQFWVSWCPRCKSEMPSFQKLYTAYGKNVSFLMVDMVGVHGETAKAAKSYVKENHYTFPIYFDNTGAASDTFGIEDFPCTYFIDKKGVVYATHTGVMNEKDMDSAIRSLLV